MRFRVGTSGRLRHCCAWYKRTLAPLFCDTSRHLRHFFCGRDGSGSPRRRYPMWSRPGTARGVSPCPAVAEHGWRWRGYNGQPVVGPPGSEADGPCGQPALKISIILAVLFKNGSKYPVVVNICGLFFGKEKIKILLLGLH